MRITTWNVNGLRAAIRKGFREHIEKIAPDILLLQETRAFPEQLPADIRQPDDWHVIWNPAEKPGYSGTAIWSRYPIDQYFQGVGSSSDAGDTEGRLLAASIRGITIGSVYLPSGSSGEHRQLIKDAWLQDFFVWAQAVKSSGPVIFGGDLNIAHTERDIFYAKANENTSGFLPHERTWLSELLESGWHDLVREHHGPVQGPYSWWSNRGKARELDRGWRIDYLLCNAQLRASFSAAEIHREGGMEVSDHAPVTVDLNV
jgi:exodeoxyribonuclease-3